MSADANVQVENVNVPGQITNVNAEKYNAMKSAFLKILPNSNPDLTQKEVHGQVKKHLPNSVYPQGASSGWWAKTVQLDLEAKGVVAREKCKPLRWHKSRVTEQGHEVRSATGRRKASVYPCSFYRR